MYLSDSELKQAIEAKKLIVVPSPKEIGATSIDLHLDNAECAKIWDVNKLKLHHEAHGVSGLEVNIANLNFPKFSKEYLITPPNLSESQNGDLVRRRDSEIIIRPGGFVLWQTSEIVGTPELDPEFICFVDGKSTRARAGLVVHLTAPTIHAGWFGKITLEISNLGPLDLVIKENDKICQITVAKLTSIPKQDKAGVRSVDVGQDNVSGTIK